INYCYDSRKNYICETGNPNILDCCDYADQVIRNSLSATFDDWKHSYRLTLRKGNDIRIPINGAQLFTNDPLCTGASEKEQPGFFYLPGSPPIIIKMELCKV
ncbi:MAG: hypothetical protein KKF44_10045, partial [Nanoarchaeota archaeon]|nr:hypothetical protein [Nanoarchaeota archaeon]